MLREDEICLHGRPTKTMADTDDGTGHLVSKLVDEKEHIATVIHPRYIVTVDIFVQNTALSEIGRISHPNASNGIAIGFRPPIQLVPKGLVGFLKQLAFRRGQK